MKRISAMFAILLGMAVATAQAQKVEIKTVTYEVNMHCQSCKAKIERDIVFEKGVKEVEATLDKKLVTVKYDATKTDPEKIAKAIEKLGYKAKVLETKQKG